MSAASDIRARISAFDRFYTLRRNKSTTDHDSRNPILRFPFVLVKTKVPNVAYSADRRRLRVSAPANFKLYSETDIVCLMAERRKPRLIAKKPRISKNTRHHHARKLHPEVPPPPPPSPADSCLQDVLLTAERRVRAMHPQAVVNLALHAFSKPGPQAYTVSEPQKTGHVDRRRDSDIPDSAKAESCLDSEIPVQFVKHEDEEDFFKDLCSKSQVRADELHPSAHGSTTDSSSSDEVGPEFERIVRNDRAKEDFDQDVSMLCDEELSDSHPESDQFEPAEKMLERGKGDGKCPRSAIAIKQEQDIETASG